MTGKENSKKAHLLEICKIMPVTFSSPTLIPDARAGSTAELKANRFTYLEANPPPYFSSTLPSKQETKEQNPLLQDNSKIYMKFSKYSGIFEGT